MNCYFPHWKPNPISNEVCFVIVFKGAQFGSQPKRNLKEQVTSLNQRGQMQTTALFYIPCFPNGFSPVKLRQITPEQLISEIFAQSQSRSVQNLQSIKSWFTSEFMKLYVFGSAIWSASSHKCPCGCAHNPAPSAASPTR